MGRNHCRQSRLAVNVRRFTTRSSNSVWLRRANAGAGFAVILRMDARKPLHPTLTAHKRYTPEADSRMVPPYELAIGRFYTTMGREDCYESVIPSTIEIGARAEDAYPRSGEWERDATSDLDKE